MGRRIRGLLLFLWRMCYPLLIYGSVVGLVAAGGVMVLLIWGGLNLDRAISLEMQEELSRQLSVPFTALGAMIAAVPLGILYVWSRWEQEIEGEACKRSRTLRLTDIGRLGILGAALCVAGNGFLMSMPFLWEGFEETNEMLYAPPFLLQLFCIGLIVPAVEELVFRGLVYRGMRKSVSVRAAMIVSALYFGVYHGNLVQGIYAAGIGVALAWVMEQYDALTAAVTVHVSANVMSLLVSNTVIGVLLSVFAVCRWAMILVCLGISVWIINKIRKENMNDETSVYCDTML